MSTRPNRTESTAGFAVDGIGKRLRILRMERKMTVKDLAEAAAVSVGTISQIERNLSSPSIRILERLRQAMDIPLMELLDASEKEVEPQNMIVRRSADRPRVELGDGAIVKQLLSPVGDHDIQFMYITLKPGVRQGDVLIGPGEKAGLVISGKAILEVDDVFYQLAEGDSFQFSSKLKHSILNDSDKETKILWIMNTNVRKIIF
ncbi:MAG: helix-turn-helix domain-containing protein [Rhizobiales bacterium]|nr:helix-turn-helix domain-containing protein [Hyphomicrobiales bacterium]OJY04867.1 MAG: hypothetical protein BGP07_09225 [Rhizobiales bacterium 63-22]